MRAELHSLLGIAPLLHARLDAPVHPRVIATDASEHAAGVVVASLEGALAQHTPLLCASRKHAILQMRVPGLTEVQPRPGQLRSVNGECSGMQHEDQLRLAREVYTSFYSTVSSTRWSLVLAAPWRSSADHINALELRAVLLALHWLLSYPSVRGHASVFRLLPTCG